MPKSKTAVATLVELGVTLAGAEASPATPATCKRCGATHDPKGSASRYPSVFCSRTCEREFIRLELASLTLEDCLRLQTKLDQLLSAVEEPTPIKKKHT